MSPVYIDCHGLRQFSKILFELTRCGMDKNDLSFSDCVETNTKNNKSFALFRVTILASDPSLLHEFLIDNLPIPSRFITCMDYDEYDADYIPEYDDPDHPDFISLTYARSMSITDRTIH